MTEIKEGKDQNGNVIRSDQKFSEKHDLPFPLISDDEKKL